MYEWLEVLQVLRDMMNEHVGMQYQYMIEKIILIIGVPAGLCCLLKIPIDFIRDYIIPCLRFMLLPVFDKVMRMPELARFIIVIWISLLGTIVIAMHILQPLSIMMIGRATINTGLLVGLIGSYQAARQHVIYFLLMLGIMIGISILQLPLSGILLGMSTICLIACSMVYQSVREAYHEYSNRVQGMTTELQQKNRELSAIKKWLNWQISSD